MRVFIEVEVPATGARSQGSVCLWCQQLEWGPQGTEVHVSVVPATGASESVHVSG